MNSLTYAELISGSFTMNFIMNESNHHKEINQIQSLIKNIITVNFVNVGKKIINIKEIKLEIIKLKQWN